MTGHRTHADPASHWAALAAEAATDVNARFGRRLMGVPGTWIGALHAGLANTGAAAQPASRTTVHPLRAPHWPWSEWHYWWQAHYLDAVIDSALLALAQGERAAARHELGRARQLLRGIMIRNFGRFPNDYYDDMAWLALATVRLDQLSLRLAARPARLARCANRSLTRQLHHAHDTVLGGGIYWSRKRDYKNTPANGPAALHFARTGETERAQAIADWLRRELFDPLSGLYLDGIHPSATGRNVENTIYTYNQGPIVAALLELGRPQDLTDAAAVIAAIHHHLTVPGQGLRLEPGGDGSLFTGILCRYLALAARDTRLPAESRDLALSMVRETAARIVGPVPTQLSAALQRWMVLSAAAG